SDQYCQGTNRTDDAHYVCGDFRLGPTTLPTGLPLGNVVFDYHRFAGLCPGEFLKAYTNASTGRYIYPEPDGWQLDVANKTINGTQTLPKHLVVDRFGNEVGGFFLAPAYTPYIQRALPPQSLNTPRDDNSFPANYHRYEVITPFNVSSGPIAPAFGQPGQGTQYHTFMDVATLVNGTFLR
ncbi:hypothetical protein PUNSTDRAFT_16283, partial [Punctularia strigosozonata HHB-11173 SS5]|uniref:uncharacterized protein n=1 Tax=Punctularia strigosozonata (strain HHB-11173) TaxID=741275 RepID=UPI00044184A8